jgi:putative two-component system response regulator
MLDSAMHWNADIDLRKLQVQSQTSMERGLPHTWGNLLRPMQLFAANPSDAAPKESPTDTEGILFALAQAVEQRDQHTAGHCKRLAFVSLAMGIFMGLDEETSLALYRGGYLHDVGKVGIPDNILFKPDHLTVEEWAVMRTHPIRGVEICRHIKTLAPVLPIIRHHHERWDGSGYPDRLRGDEIPLTARIVQIADIYDALTSSRSYKSPFSPDEALDIIRAETDKGWRDPQVVEVFFKLHKDVIAKAGDYAEGGDRNLEALRAALFRTQFTS